MAPVPPYIYIYIYTYRICSNLYTPDSVSLARQKFKFCWKSFLGNRGCTTVFSYEMVQQLKRSVNQIHTHTHTTHTHAPRDMIVKPILLASCYIHIAMSLGRWLKNSGVSTYSLHFANEGFHLLYLIVKPPRSNCKVEF